MKHPLSITEQETLRSKGILASDEIAYQENSIIYAENALTGIKRVINTLNIVKESKNILLG